MSSNNGLAIWITVISQLVISDFIITTCKPAEIRIPDQFAHNIMVIEVYLTIMVIVLFDL